MFLFLQINLLKCANQNPCYNKVYWEVVIVNLDAFYCLMQTPHSLFDCSPGWHSSPSQHPSPGEFDMQRSSSFAQKNSSKIYKSQYQGS